MVPELTIFYTDDDFDDLEMFTNAAVSLQQKVDVRTYNRGDKLIEAIKNPPPVPHIIFLDLNMPGKNGFDVIKELRSSGEFKEIPIVIYSTSRAQQDVDDCKSLGANYFATKPSSITELSQLINHVISIDWKSFFPNSREFVHRG